MGRALLAELEAWAWDLGASQVTLGAAAPFYLWPGVDVRALAMSCLAESAGYRELGLALNMSVPATFRAPAPEGIVIERVLEDVDVAAVEALVARHWPEWTPETSVGLAQGSCFAGFDRDRRAVGFACHSVNRAGWFGPTGTDPACRGAGIGHALLAEVCRDAMVSGYADVEISWIGPMRFYAKAGGSVSRVFRMLQQAQAQAVARSPLGRGSGRDRPATVGPRSIRICRRSGSAIGREATPTMTGWRSVAAARPGAPASASAGWLASSTI